MEMKQITLAALCVFSASSSYAEDVPITGTVQSRCIIQTDTAGVYGNPNAYTLTTAPADGGVVPVVRFDVSLADAYKGRITYPTSFSASPSLNDTPVWSGSVEVDKVGDVAMADYQTDSITYDQTREYDLTATGSTWFKINSSAVNGGEKAFPGGTYRAVAQAECIAK
jgi:hypothetical protein